jgi:polyhydroxyalkanoate synthase
MRHFVSHQPDAIRFGMGHRSRLGFEFFELMTRMMTDPVVVASAQIDLFYNTLVFCPASS